MQNITGLLAIHHMKLISPSNHLLNKQVPTTYLIVSVLDEPTELARAGHVAALANVDKVRVGPDAHGFKAAQRHVFSIASVRDLSGRVRRHRLRDGADVFGCRAAAAANNVQQSIFGPLLYETVQNTRTNTNSTSILFG